MLDCEDAIATVGLVDGHCHLCLSGQLDPLEESREHSDGDLVELARQNARKALASGVTLLRDCGVPSRVFPRLAASLRPEAGFPRILWSGAPLTTVDGHIHHYGGAVIGSSRTIVDQQLANGASWIKVMVSGGFMTPSSDPHAVQFSAEQLSEIVRYAHSLGARVSVHAHSIEAIDISAHAGVDSIEHLSWLSPNGGIAFQPDIARTIVSKGILVSPTLNARFYLDRHQPGQRPVEEEFRQARWDMVRRMWASGATILPSTDAGVWLTPFGELWKSLVPMADKCGIPWEDVGRMVSVDAYRSLCPQLQVGLEVGAVADISVFESHPFSDTTTDSPPATRFVLVNGHLYEPNALANC